MLVVREVNLKANDRGIVLLHVKEIETPMSLTASDIACIQILLGLIIAGVKLHSDAVMALIHILVNVFDCLNRGN